MLDLYIAVPTARDWKPEFGVSMIGLTHHLGRLSRQGKIRGFYLQNKITSLLPKGRQMMLDEALAGDYTHMLWIDDDTQFPAEVVDLLLSRDKPYVSVNMCKKVVGAGWCAKYKDGNEVVSTGKTGIEQAAWAGLGMALLDLRKLRESEDFARPHFEIIWINDEVGYLGEDMYFCEKLRKAGCEIWVDHDAANLVSHVGNFGYGPQTAHAPKKAA